MEPRFQTSFIPKKPIINDARIASSSSVVRESNVFNLIAVIVFVATLLASGGLFGYKIYLKQQIDKDNKDISDAQAAFQVDKIKELLDANNRILASKDLLDKHVAVSSLLTLLQSLTVRRLRLVTLDYSNKTGQNVISLSGQAQNYNALVEQSRIFEESQYLSNNIFSNFTLEDNGYIKVDFDSAVDTSLISYKKALEAVNTTGSTTTNNTTQ